MLVRDRVGPAPVNSAKASSQGWTAFGAIDGVRMGYGNCTVSGCTCQGYVDSYDSTHLCQNCRHAYTMHS